MVVTGNRLVCPTSMLSVPEVSAANVHSIPFKTSSDWDFQNTFSLVSRSPASSSNVSLNTFRSSTSLSAWSCNPHTSPNETPALKNLLHSKKSTLYKARKPSSRDLPLLIGASSLENDSLSTASDEMISISSFSGSSLPSLDSDNLSITEVGKDDHPLAPHSENSGDEENEEEADSNEILKQNQSPEEPETTESQGGDENTPLNLSVLHSLKKTILKSSFVASAKLFCTNKEPILKNTATLLDISNTSIIFNDVLPLETYHTVLKPIHGALDTEPTNLQSILKPRECRINPTFLRFYAIDSTIKLKHPHELLNPSLVDFYYSEFVNSGIPTVDEFLKTKDHKGKDTDTLKFQLLSRDKMFSRVVLKPREDLYQNCNYNSSSRKSFIKIRSESIKDGSLIRSNGKVMPWFNMNDCNTPNKRCFTPLGVLPNNIQYTVKNWENERWSSDSI